MKKTFKLLAALLIAEVTFCAFGEKANAAASTLKLGDAKAVKAYVAGTYFTTKTTSDGRYLYCLNIHKATAKNTTAKLVKERDAGFAYIIQNGYPHKRFTKDKMMDYYITQTAVWWYLDDTTGSNNLTNSFKTTGSDPYKLRPYIKKLVAGAKQAKKNGYAKTSIATSVSDTNMILTSDSKYFESKVIKVKSSNIKKYSVSANNGVIVTDINGKAKNTFNAGENFKVRVPATSVKNTINVSVTVKATGSVGKAYEYAPKDSSMQHVIPSFLYAESKTVNSKISLKATEVEKPQVSIIKLDKKTEEAIAGATLKLTDANGNEITTWTTTTQEHIIKNLPNGTYTIEETEAPEGYKLSEDKVSFTVDGTVKNQTVKFYNEAKDRVVNIMKIDKSTGEALAGAEIVVKDSTGEEIARFVSTTDPYIITNIADGTYTVEEVSAPTGYVKSEEIISFTVDSEHLSHQIKIENYPQVEVPDTDSNSGVILTILGIGLIGLGYKFIKKYDKKKI